MCGITGLVDLSGTPIDPQILVKMNAAIRHRGRDDEGYVLVNTASNQFIRASGDDSPSVIQKKYPRATDLAGKGLFHLGLAHRRFSIIDLSPGGHQPFFNRDQSCCVVFNGEIYNYLEVRQELTQKGYTFTTSSDTEVLAEAYSHWGTDCFQHFNGFWAVAIYDFKEQCLILARDRMGKKPLYYAVEGSRVYFASEIKALLQVDQLTRSLRVNEDTAQSWLIYGQRDTTSDTLFDGIYSLPPASWTIVDQDFPNHTQSFWQIPSTRLTEKDISVAEASAGVLDILRDAVRIRMRADVPWSVELSGGMDSSALVALASELSSNRIQTYTVRFSEPDWNEEHFARSIAEHFATDHQVIDSPLQNFWPSILPFTYLQEEPYHSPNLHTNQVIWTLMRASDTKVSLNGAAGDELFAGYRHYFYDVQTENWQTRQLINFVKNIAGWTEGRLPGEALARSIVALPFGNVTLRDIYRRVRQQHPEALKQNDVTRQGVDSHSIHNRLTSVLYDDLRINKIPYWVRSGDKTYMGVPFEVRAPFLDYRLVEYVSRLPASYLVREGWHKWILRKALTGLLPDDVLWRKRKLGFPFPYEEFHRESEPIMRLIWAKANNPYMNRLQAHRDDPSWNSWRSVSFILWYELFFNKNRSLFEQIQAMATSSSAQADYGYVPGYLETVVNIP